METSHLYGEPAVGGSGGAFELGEAESQGITRAGKMVLAKLIESSDLVPAWGAQQRNNGICYPDPSSPLPEASQFRSFPYVPGTF